MDFFPAPAQPFKGRGAVISPTNRFQEWSMEGDPESFDPDAPGPRTRFYPDQTTNIICTNDSPDIGFTASVNPYRGCEHGCVYCYARPTHEYLGWSAGLDFESKIMVKFNAPELLRRELSAKKWKPQHIAISGVTDCYQPAEKKFRITRGCLEVLAEFRNPVGLVTKNHLICRDLDVLQELNRHQCVMAFVSVTTLDSDLARKLEPRASLPAHRLDAIATLAAAGIPVGVMVAPVIPGLTDVEIPRILKATREAGAQAAGTVMLRLPYAVKDLFNAWLETHFPEKRDRILARVQHIRGGKLNESAFGKRMSGEGVFADQIHQLFDVSKRKAGFPETFPRLSTENFRRPGGSQMELF